jgi:hypothetical protein
MCKCINQDHIDILFYLREHYVSVYDRFALLGQFILLLPHIRAVGVP